MCWERYCDAEGQSPSVRPTPHGVVLDEAELEAFLKRASQLHEDSE